jgi:hypothetical protein
MVTPWWGFSASTNVLDLHTQEAASIARLLEKQKPHIPV